MEPIGSFVPYIFIAIAILLIGAVWLSRRHRRAQLLELAGLFDDRPQEVRGLFTLSMSGRLRDRAATIELEPGGKNRPPKLHVRLDCRTTFEVRIAKEFAGSGILKKLRLVKDVETGDPGLDSAYRFAAAEEERLRTWLRGNEEARRALRALLEVRGWTEIDLAEQRLTATRERYGAADLEPGSARGVLEDLAGLARTLEQGV